MSNKPCKALRKDGSPCKGHALDQYDGYCLAHGAPPEQAHEWRARGGKNSATAVRIEKRMPEQFTLILDLLVDGMKQVMDGSLTPARYDAVCRGAKATLDAYSRIEQEMKRVRAEEIDAAAAEHLDANPNLEILEAADRKKAAQDRYRRESLVHQGFARFDEPATPDGPPAVVLIEKGRRCLGYRNYESTQALLEKVDDELVDFNADSREIPDLPKITALLQGLQEDVEKTLSGLPHVAARPFDPLTGQAVTKLPAGVILSPYRGYAYDFDEDPREALGEQLRVIEELRGKVKRTSEEEAYKRRVAERDQGQGVRARLEAHLQARTSKT